MVESFIAAMQLLWLLNYEEEDVGLLINGQRLNTFDDRNQSYAKQSTLLSM